MRVRALVAAGLVTALAAGGLAGAAGARSGAGQVQADLLAARDLLAASVDPATGGAAARLALVERAGGHVRKARARLRAWPLGQLAALPVLGRDVRVARSVAAAADATVAATATVVRRLGPLEAGGPDGRRLLAASAAMAELGATLRAGAARVSEAEPLLLAAPARTDFLATSAAKARTAEAASQGLRLAASLYGRPGAVRWFLGFQNPAELRGTGGLLGQYGILESSPSGPRLAHVGPYLELDQRLAGRSVPLPGPVAARYGRFAVGRAWSAVNIPPDLPTVARLIQAMYARSTGQRLAGVLLVDPVAVAGVLAVSGPLTVRGIRIDAANVVAETLVKAYVRWAGDDEARKRFLADVAKATFAAARRRLAADPLALARALSGAVDGRHVQLWVADAAAQRALAGLPVAGGAAPPPAGDYLMPVGVNAAGNKLDAFLHRRLRWEVRLQPDGEARASARLSLRNAVPAGGDLPAYVVGPYDARFQRGEQRQFQSLYLAGGYAFTAATENGHPVGAESQPELGATVLSRYVAVQAGRTRTLGFELRRPGAATLRGGQLHYQLTLRPQPVVNPDLVDVVVRAPAGWRVASAPPGSALGAGGASAGWSGRLEAERRLEFVLAPPS